MAELLRVFDDADLLPPTWVNAPMCEYNLFNPAIVRFQDQIIMAYRVVLPDGRRWLALCRLTEAMQVIPGSVVPFSDSIQQGGQWHADARFVIFRERLFIHYNDGSPKPNHIYLIEVDPERLVARGPARELLLQGERRLVEKNWMLFVHDDELWAIYSICPHIVLKLIHGDDGPVLCRRVYQQDWDATSYVARYGQLRGGTPPVRMDDHYVSFFHSCFVARPFRRLLFRILRKEPTDILHYVGSVYGFAAEPPFAPLWWHAAPLIKPPNFPRRRKQLHLRVEHSVYPCGAIVQDQRWIVSFGSRNEYCCLAMLPAEAITSARMITRSVGPTQDSLYYTTGRNEK